MTNKIVLLFAMTIGIQHQMTASNNTNQPNRTVCLFSKITGLTGAGILGWRGIQRQLNLKDPLSQIGGGLLVAAVAGQTYSIIKRKNTRTGTIAPHSTPQQHPATPESDNRN